MKLKAWKLTAFLSLSQSNVPGANFENDMPKLAKEAIEPLESECAPTSAGKYKFQSSKHEVET